MKVWSNSLRRWFYLSGLAALVIATGFWRTVKVRITNYKLRITAALVITGIIAGGVINSVLLISSTQAAVGINQQLNFQARLLNSAGAVVPDGNYNIQFKIYQDGDGVLGGGDEVLKWTESRLNNNSQGVVVKNGYFSVMLGSVTAFGSSVDWNQDSLWLSLHIGGTNATCTPFATCAGSETEMSPFKRLGANPYALNSGQLGGLTSGQYVQLAQGLQVDASATNASIAINKTGNASILQLQRAGVDVAVIDGNGTATLQATGNNVSLLVKQTANGAPTTDIFSVSGANGSSKFIGVTSTAANAGSVTVQSLGSNALTLDSGAGLSVGVTNATSVAIGRSGVAVTLQGSATINEILTIGNGSGNDFADFAEESGNPGCAAGNYRIWANSTDGKLKKCENGVLTDLNAAGGGVTMQNTYDNSSGTPVTITTSSATKNIKIAAGAAPTTSLLQIDNAGQAVATNDANGLDINYVGGAAAVEAAGLKIDFAPGGTSNGVWSGLRIVANTTGPATGVTEYGIKLEGPTVDGAGLTTGMKLTTGWDIGIDIGSGGLQLAVQADPPTPVADNLRIYATKLSGRTMLEVKGPSGVDYTLQPSLFQSAISMCAPASGSTLNSMATTCVVGTAGNTTHPTVNETFGYMTNFATSGTNGNDNGVSTTNPQWIRGSAAGANGFFYNARLGTVDTLLGERIFTGLTDQTMSTTVSSDNPAGHHVGFQISTGRIDTNWQFVTKNGTTQTVTNTNMAYAANKIFDFYFYVTPAGTTIYWRVDNMTDATSQEGSVSATLPGSTTPLRMVTGVDCNVCVTGRNIRMSRIYVEADK